ncbi:REP element-mobilizing transposase RayT [Cyclobacterium xiamenense]|uniref:REP element-mobilizing transposase RayT n=1 Tax=Cyclobacterium xiamenense TaxID=1297121 RepID=A0A1H6T4P8_9BACT|nr:transposase [Cyclobacterium xiamenense]SEI75018.1 REP element-mobilizing transposase RayT [Cyclobacterium xiamenense]
MKYKPNIHHRRSIRLKGYDYSREGLYFITICCQDMICRFGYIENDEMQLNEFGQIAYDEWMKLFERFNNMQIDVFQIMPNHIHGIISLHTPTIGAGFTPAQNARQPQIIDWESYNDGQPRGIAPTVSDIVGAYKSLVANGSLDIYKSKNETMGTLWQRNYYDHIIRNENSYRNITDYIINNPANWGKDKFYQRQ